MRFSGGVRGLFVGLLAGAALVGRAESPPAPAESDRGSLTLAPRPTPMESSFTVDPAFAPALERALATARTQRFAESDAWHALGHYRKTSWGRWKSDVDTPNFFFSPQGRRDAEAELVATLRGFFASGAYDREHQHPRCRFPARAQLLAERLQIAPGDWPAADCGRFELFRQRIGAQSASLVFSSYYLNNPSSALGHLLLRFSRAGDAHDGERAELLDYGINYAAEVNTRNPVLYALRGFLGYFPGTFTSMPYYYKVREYNDFEARDIWEYNLALTPAEVALAVAHVWEMGPVSIDYYYLDENCATHVLTLVAAVRPTFRVDERLPSGIVMPTDAIRAVADAPGLLREVRYRPSIRSLLQKRVDGLRAPERETFRALARGAAVGEALEGFDAPTRARVLDAALDEIDDRAAKELLINETGAEALRRQDLLVARAMTGVQTPRPEFPGIAAARAPHRGHLPRRVSVYGGGGFDGAYAGLALRMGFHDRLDNPTGRFDSADVEFLSARVRRELRDHRWALDEAKVIELRSLSDLASLRPSPSWGFRLGARRFREEACASCVGGMLEGGIGLAWNVGHREDYGVPGAWLFALAEPNFSFVPGRTRHAWGAELGPRVGVSVRPLESLAFEGSVAYAFPVWDVRPSWSSLVRGRWHEQKGWSVDLAWKRNSLGHEFEAALGRDF